MSGTIVGSGTITSSGAYTLDPTVLAVFGTASATVEGAGTNANIQLSALAGTILTAATTYTVDVLAGATATVTPPTNVLSLLTTINLIADGGTVALANGGSVIGLLNGPINGTVEAGGTLDFSAVPAGSDSSTNATFSGTGGTLDIGKSTTTNPQINGFGGATDIIDDKSINYAKVTGYTVTQSGGNDVITFKEKGGKSATVTVQGTPLATGTFGLGGGPLVLSAAGDGTLVFAACFLAGTRIASDRGEIAVEKLGKGDLVHTGDGRLAPVRWIGHRTVRLADVPNPLLIAPICIAAQAIAPALPQRDLWVTPDHGIVVDGHLIPARLLVNGATIRQVELANYTYYHVELDEHAILLAEGLGAESYLDTGNRSAFSNNCVVALDARLPESQAAAYAERGCMALTLDPVVTRSVWTRLADRAALLGRPVSHPVITRDPKLRLRTAAGRSIRPLQIDATRAIFALPLGVSEVTIESRATMPWSATPWIDDRRTLGVAIGRILVRSAERSVDVAIDGPALGDGWWDTERTNRRAFRWTSGAARIALPPAQGAVTLEVTLVDRACHLAEISHEAASEASMALAG